MSYTELENTRITNLYYWNTECVFPFLTFAVLHEDEDDEFDVSTFTVPRYFNGTFQLPNLVVTENPSNQTVIDLEGKVSIWNNLLYRFIFIDHNLVFRNTNGGICLQT